MQSTSATAKSGEEEEDELLDEEPRIVFDAAAAAKIADPNNSTVVPNASLWLDLKVERDPFDLYGGTSLQGERG